MKRIMFLLVMLFTWQSSKACDICGGSASIAGANGVIPFFNINQMGLSFGQVSMRHPNTLFNQVGNEAVQRDILSSINLQGLFFVHPKWQIQGSIPLIQNERLLENGSQMVSGIGDIQAMANYLLVNQSDSTKKKFKTLVMLGGGFSLPTGKYQQRGSDLAIYPIGLQTGVGAFQYILQQQSSVRHKNWGLLFNSRVIFSEENELFYQLGNSFSNQLNLFRTFKKGNNQFIPQLGIGSLIAKTDTKNGQEVEATAINSWSGLVAISWFYKKWNIQINAGLPLSQTLSNIQPKQEIGYGVRLGYFLVKK